MGEQADLKREWSEGEGGPLDALVGTHRAEVPGAVADRGVRTLMRFTGMPGWWGKRFWETDEGSVLEGANLLERGDGLEESVPMRAVVKPSAIDGQPVMAIEYPDHAPRPWRWVRDEMRMVEEGELVGMTLVPGTPLERAPGAFRLHRAGPPDG